MKQFIKTTEKSLTGSEKAAILLAEIGPLFNENYDEIEKALHLLPDEVAKIRKAMENLGQYAPAKKDYAQGMSEIRREQNVLQEVLDFGQRRGIVNFNRFQKQDKNKSSCQQTLAESVAVQNVVAMAKNEPETIAKVLSGWLEE